MSPLLLVLTALLLLVAALASAAISALETALFSLKEHHIALLGDRRPELTGMMRAVARQPQRSLHQVLILSTLFHLALAVIGLFLFREVGPGIPHHPYSSAAILFGGIVLGTELIPTLAALAAPAQVFQILVVPFIRISPWLEPVSLRLDRLANSLSRWLLPASFRPRATLTDDEVETLVDMRREKGVLADHESEMIHEIIRLGNKTAKDCLTPRVDTLMIPDTANGSQLEEKLRQAPKWYWHVPVYQGSPDTVVGVVDVRRWLYRGAGDFGPFIEPPVFLPETMNALEVFRDYLSLPRSLCVVLDEYGGVEGVLSHSDLVDEFLWNAAPAPERDEGFEILAPGHLRADGDARLDELEEVLGLEMEREGIDTIGGLVFNELGQVPSPRTVVTFESFEVVVRQCQRQRITGVEIRVTDPPTDSDSP